MFIAVGTPSRRGDGHADLSYVFAVAEEIAASLSNYAVIVTKSTVPVDTNRKVEKIIRKLRPDADFDVASNPEFLREGSAIEDFRRPDRVVVGCESERAREVMKEVYRAALPERDSRSSSPALESAELIKYAANAFLAMKITFINEMANLCEKVGGGRAGRGARHGARWPHRPQVPARGPGFGGSCFPKDTLALMRIAEEAGAPSRLTQSVVAVNDARKEAMAARVVAACGGDVTGKTIAVLGLAFKPGTDDMREAPSLPLVRGLISRGARCRLSTPRR